VRGDGSGSASEIGCRPSSGDAIAEPYARSKFGWSE